MKGYIFILGPYLQVGIGKCPNLKNPEELLPVCVDSTETDGPSVRLGRRQFCMFMHAGTASRSLRLDSKFLCKGPPGQPLKYPLFAFIVGSGRMTFSIEYVAYLARRSEKEEGLLQV